VGRGLGKGSDQKRERRKRRKEEKRGKGVGPRQPAVFNKKELYEAGYFAFRRPLWAVKICI